MGDDQDWSHGTRRGRHAIALPGPGGLMRGATGLVLFGIFPVSVNAQRPTPAAASALVFDGVTVIDVARGRLVPNRRVVIVGNRIRAVVNGGTGATPKGARVVNAQGKYLIPGLWDTHTHIQERDSGALYLLSVANGVTGIRDAGSAVPLQTLRRWQREILAGTRVGPPRQMLSGVAINQDPEGGACPAASSSLHYCVADTTGVRHLVDSLAAVGADMIKLRHVSKAVYTAVAAAAKRRGLPFGGHAEGDVFVRLPQLNTDHWPDQGITSVEASDRGATIIDHALGGPGCWPDRLELMRDSSKRTIGTVDACRERIKRFRRNSTWFTPTLFRTPFLRVTLNGHFAERFNDFTKSFWAGSAVHGNWLHDVVSLDLHPDSAPATVAATPQSSPDSLRARALRDLVRRELPVLVGTDFGGASDGFNVHAELATLVVEGWTPVNALRAATLNPAKAFRATDSLGTVAPGKLADLVLLDANPLEDITNTTAIHAVVANGRYFDRAALDDLLAKVRTANPNP